MPYPKHIVRLKAHGRGDGTTRELRICWFGMNVIFEVAHVPRDGSKKRLLISVVVPEAEVRDKMWKVLPRPLAKAD